MAKTGDNGGARETASERAVATLAVDVFSCPVRVMVMQLVWTDRFVLMRAVRIRSSLSSAAQTFRGGVYDFFIPRLTSSASSRTGQWQPCRAG
jgi:hypothetical protein